MWNPIKRKKMCNLIIIDASSSMASKKEEVIGGLKSLFGDIRKGNIEIDQHTIVCDFSTAGDFRVLVNSSTVEDLKDSDANTYTTRGMTALFDAIGKAFQLVPTDVDGVFVNILTDGEENDSKEWTQRSLKTLIEDKTSKKWGITFMGTTEEAALSAQGLGIKTGNITRFSDSKKGVLKSSMDRGMAYTAYMSSVSTGLQEKDLDTLMKDAEKNKE